jgi:enoyl-CoA hydratase/carnithine racemase
MELPDDVRYEIGDDGIALITLNRPHEGNAITPAMHKGLRKIWRDVDENPAVRVAIITGAGERHFCTGASVSGLSTDGEDSAMKQGTMEEVNHLSPSQN